MKSLYLIRHAKASWEQDDTADFDRPLVETGEEDARVMGRELKEMGVKPDYILSSPALRAISTAKIIAEELKFSSDKIITDNLIYSGGVEDLIECIKQINPKFNTVLCVGHNPNFTWLCHNLCEDTKMNIPTCGVVGIKFAMKNWNELIDAESEVLFFIHPDHEVT